MVFFDILKVMLRPRVVFALSLSILLIGGAILHRFVFASVPQNSLVAIQEPTNSVTDVAPIVQNDVVATSTSTTKTNISTTDLLSRQLLSDYLAMATQGQTTDQSIASLADKYAETIVSLNTSTINEIPPLRTVPDSKTNLEAYGSSLSKTYQKYHDLTAMVIKKSGDISDPGSAAFASAMKSLSILFKQSALELEQIPVPTSFSDLHTKLIKNYLSSALTFVSLADVSKDATGAFGALSAQAQNSSDQAEILSQIQVTLLTNGVYFSY